MKKNKVIFTFMIGGHLGVVELLVDRGGCGEGPAGLYGVDEEGLGPLHHAVLQGHQHVVRLLLDKGAAVNKPDLKGRIPTYILWK